MSGGEPGMDPVDAKLNQRLLRRRLDGSGYVLDPLRPAFLN